jgi:hypothetical protein
MTGYGTDVALDVISIELLHEMLTGGGQREAVTGQSSLVGPCTIPASSFN